MKNKGFTIVELLAVIIILSVIIIFVTPAIFESSKSAKEKTYETKVHLIEKAAVIYADEIFNINDGTQKSITVGELAQRGKIVYDDDKKEIIEDPRGKYSSLNNCRIDITINTSTKRIEAKLNEDSCKGTE